MIRKIAALMLSLALVVGIAGWKKNVQATAENWVIYFVPHPDDEALTFSVPIMNDIGAGKKVKLVLLSHGEESIAREVVNGQYDNQSRFYWKAGKIRRESLSVLIVFSQPRPTCQPCLGRREHLCFKLLKPLWLMPRF